MTVNAIGAPEPVQADLVHDIDHEPGEVILGQPLRHVRRQQEPLSPIRRHEVFSEAVARNRGRFALPDELDEVLAPLKEHMQRRADKDSAEGHCVDAVVQVRAESDRDWDLPAAQTTIHFIVDVDHLPATDDEYPSDEPDASEVAMLSDAADVAAKIEFAAPDDVAIRQALWQRLTELWVAPCEPNDAVSEVVGMVASEAEFTLFQMRYAHYSILTTCRPGKMRSTRRCSRLLVGLSSDRAVSLERKPSSPARIGQGLQQSVLVPRQPSTDALWSGGCATAF